MGGFPGGQSFQFQRSGAPSAHWVLRWTSAGGARSPSPEKLRVADDPQDRRRPLGAGVSSSPQDGETHLGRDPRLSVTACEGDSDDLVSPPPPDLPLLPPLLLIRFQVFSFISTEAAWGSLRCPFHQGLAKFAMQR